MKKPASKSAKKSKKPEKPSIFYILCWNRKFTLLEDFVLKVLEENDARADATIAQILCLNVADIPDIVGSDRLKECVQGDDSRRTLMSGFTRKEFAVASNAESRVGKKHFCSVDCLDFLRLLKRLGAKDVPAELRRQQASRYYELDRRYYDPDPRRGPELDLIVNMPGEIRDALKEFGQ